VGFWVVGGWGGFQCCGFNCERGGGFHGETWGCGGGSDRYSNHKKRIQNRERSAGKTSGQSNRHEKVFTLAAFTDHGAHLSGYEQTEVWR